MTKINTHIYLFQILFEMKYKIEGLIMSTCIKRKRTWSAHDGTTQRLSGTGRPLRSHGWLYVFTLRAL